LQLLFDDSEEDVGVKGLGIVAGSVRRFTTSLKVPHMGWNELHPHREHPLLEGIADGAHVYFVHSYFCDAPAAVTIASSDYGRDFAAIVGRENVLGVQFHPEKSQQVGLRMVANFVRFVETSRRAA
jgi:glutamine amidotransferase